MFAGVWCCWGWLDDLGFSPGPRSLGMLVTSSTIPAVYYSLIVKMEIVWMPFEFALLGSGHRGE